jgi:hypothetical protein
LLALLFNRMSTSPESGSPELGLDLDLHFLPAWAQKPAENKYAKFEGTEEGFERRRGDRGDRRERRGDRPPRREEGRVGGHPSRPDRAGGGSGRDFGRQRPHDRGRRPEHVEPAAPPVELNVSLIPEEKGVESLARQIRLAGRAYPLFDIAFLILKKPERYTVRFNVIKKPDGQVAQPLFLCALDDTIWLSEQEVVDYILGKHFATFYQPERTPTDPPKGTYTFVAQCGMSGTILGPPNYHDYQNKLRKLHAERFSRMPFEVFKTRIKIVRDEAIVKKWLDDQSWKTEYICLNVPETLKLGTREEVEQHFRQIHLANVIKPIESHTLGGPAAQALPTFALQRLVRRAWEEQMRFPLKMVNVLSQQFAGHGLQFFKVNKTVTHVAVARPRYLDLDLTPVSEGVRRIVDFILATPNCTRRKIIEALVPTPPPPPAGAAPATPGTEPAPSPEMATVISDLHWLIHQGHVIEFAKGLVEMAKKPIPRPPKPEPTPSEPGANQTAEQGAIPEGASSPVEGGSSVSQETSPENPEGSSSPSESPAPAASAPVSESAPAEPSAASASCQTQTAEPELNSGFAPAQVETSAVSAQPEPPPVTVPPAVPEPSLEAGR